MMQIHVSYTRIYKKCCTHNIWEYLCSLILTCSIICEVLAAWTSWRSVAAQGTKFRWFLEACVSCRDSKLQPESPYCLLCEAAGKPTQQETRWHISGESLPNSRFLTCGREKEAHAFRGRVLVVHTVQSWCKETMYCICLASVKLPPGLLFPMLLFNPSLI